MSCESLVTLDHVLPSLGWNVAVLSFGSVGVKAEGLGVEAVAGDTQGGLDLHPVTAGIIAVALVLAVSRTSLVAHFRQSVQATVAYHRCRCSG